MSQVPGAPCPSPCHFIEGVRHAVPCCSMCGMKWSLSGAWTTWDEEPDSTETVPAPQGTHQTHQYGSGGIGFD